MHCTSGRVILNKAGHQVAYCAQNPWLEHATIHDNIIFGAGYGYDEARYEAVVEACALAKDFEIFTAGDMTGMTVFWSAPACLLIQIASQKSERRV